MPTEGIRLYASGKNGSRYAVTNNEELATKALHSLGFNMVSKAITQAGEPEEIMFFNDDGQMVPIEELFAPNNYK